MKRPLYFGVLAVAALFVSPALAQTTSTSTATNTAGSSATIVNNAPRKTRIETTTSAVAPGLAASVNSCAGSSSGGVSVPAANVVFGTTWAMRGCELRAKAAALQGLGQNGMAFTVLCFDEDIAAAAEYNGVVCPQRAAAVAQARAQQQQAEAYAYAQAQANAATQQNQARAATVAYTGSTSVGVGPTINARHLAPKGRKFKRGDTFVGKDGNTYIVQ